MACVTGPLEGKMFMPEKRAIEKARKAKQAGKAPTTQAGEFVREEVHKIRRGEYGARSPRQVIAIGLSKARRAGVAVPAPAKGRARASTRRGARYAYEAGQGKRKTSHRPPIAGAVSKPIRRPRTSASRAAMSRQARSAASRRTPAQRSVAAQKAVRTKGPAGLAAAAQAAVRTKVRTSSRGSGARNGTGTREKSPVMIRKLKSGGYRLYSRRVDPNTGKRRNLGTFATRAQAERHEHAVQYFKHLKTGSRG